jgi:hypothetical protein
MKLINPTSLAKTLDALNHAFFFGEKITAVLIREAATWIASRHGKKGAYADMFAPTRSDFASGIRLFTGERMGSNAGIGHILGEEACRALHLLNVKNKQVKEALKEATAGIQERLNSYAYQTGTYCCGTCTVSVWRHALVGKLRDREMLFAKGIKTLINHRLGDGKWRRFPFYYTLLALSDIDLPDAIREIKYTVPVLERMLRRKASTDKYGVRRRILAERILEKI